MVSTGGTWAPERREHEHRVIEALVAARAEGDTDAIMRARDELILMHTGFVQHIAHKHFQHVDEDMIQAGMEGLIEAVDRFDPQYGTALSTYAVHRIQAAMRSYRDRHTWSVHAPRHLRQLNARIRMLEEEQGASLSVPEIAERLDVEMHEVLEAKSLDHLRFAASLDASTETDEPLDTGKEDASMAQVEARETIRALLECLDDRERTVVTGLMLDGRVQQEIADSLGISQSQVSRIRDSALERMRAAHEA